MKFLLLQPRLDCSFKEGHVPSVKGPPNHPLRIHWDNFFARIKEYCVNEKHTLYIIERPLWQFNQDEIDVFLETKSIDYTFVPHKSFRNFQLNNSTCLCYMQQSLPWLFSIDRNGWQSDTEFFPLKAVSQINNGESFRRIRKEWVEKNQSKFKQPDIEVNLPDEFIFFPCQIPHDESIKYHSEISAVESLKHTCEFAINQGIDLVIKPHPVNPASMQSQYDVYQSYKHMENIHWVSNVSVQQCLRECEAMFAVNSGTGIEAILWKKPIFIYGMADYSSVAWDARSAVALWPNRDRKIHLYENFISSYEKAHYDVNDINSFMKLEKYNAS